MAPPTFGRERLSSDSEERPASARPVIPADMKGFNQRLISDFRATGGKLSGPMTGRSLLLLTTVGVRSGEARTVVLGYGRVDERYVVIASNNGASSHPSW